MLEERIAAARGERPADLVLRNARLVNVLTGEIHPADIAVAGGRVLGWGDYAGAQELDLAGRYVCPGLIDAHVHIESSMVSPAEFARAVVPAGTTAVVSDPHEIANVLGIDGIRYMLRASEGLPLTVYVMLPPSVPATPMETAGAALAAGDLAQLLGEERVLGLGEMMNFPGVLAGVPEVLDMLRMIGDRPIDGHAPGVAGRDLNAYVGAGIRSDHESTQPDEALAKLRAGMQLLIREGTTARNLEPLLGIVTAGNAGRCSFCTDDRHPATLLDEGHVDDLVRKAIAHGLDPITAIRMGSHNTACHYGLAGRGAVAPGYWADLLVLDDLDRFAVAQVYKAGRLVAEGRRILPQAALPAAPPLQNTFDVAWDRVSLRVPAEAGEMRVIGVVPGQVVTERLRRPATVQAGDAVADPARDLLKIAVIERHRGSGHAGVGFVEGFGMRRGAIASSVAHDSHNIVVVGASDAEMLLAARTVAEMAGGQVVVAGEEVVARLPLPIAGLMSDQPLETVRRQLDALIAACRDLGCTLDDPLMTMSFLALAVIPSLKLTDQGLVDVEQFAIVPLWM